MNVRFLPDDQTVEVGPEKTLLQAAIEGHIPLSHLCGGQTRCTTCRLRVVGGIENCDPRTEQEQAIADQAHFPDDIRLACQTTITGNLEVRRLVVDDEDLAMTTQAVVERVRTEIFQMERASDLSRIIAVLWEGLHDVGLHIDYCAVEIQREGERALLPWPAAGLSAATTSNLSNETWQAPRIATAPSHPEHFRRMSDNHSRVSGPARVRMRMHLAPGGMSDSATADLL